MKNWLKQLDDLINRHRPMALLFTVVATLSIVALINWTTGSHLFRQFFFPQLCDPKAPLKCDPLEWKELFQASVLVLGLPVAFMLWHWRDRNVRDQIEGQRNQVDNQRKDVNLKEFVEVQKMAAGLFDEKMDGQAQTDLQIAALHQLSDFLGDDHPTSFRRAAFEILWPSDGVSEEKTLSFGEWCKRESNNNPPTGRLDWEAAASQSDRNVVAYSEYVDKQFEQLDRVARARISILHDNWKQYFQSGFPLNSRDFSFLNLPIDADLSQLNLSGCRFIRCGIERVKFNGAKLMFSIFDRSFAQGASFREVDMFGAYIVYAGLSLINRGGANPRSQPVDFRNANLSQVHLQHSSCFGALLQGASLPRLREGLSLENAVFDDATTIEGISLDVEPHADREARWQEAYATHLRALGARHENES